MRLSTPEGQGYPVYAKIDVPKLVPITPSFPKDCAPASYFCSLEIHCYARQLNDNIFMQTHMSRCVTV